MFVSVPVSAGGFGGDPSVVAKEERGGAVVAVAGRSLLVADASISVGSDIYFIGVVGI